MLKNFFSFSEQMGYRVSDQISSMSSLGLFRCNVVSKWVSKRGIYKAHNVEINIQCARTKLFSENEHAKVSIRMNVSNEQAHVDRIKNNDRP